MPGLSLVMVFVLPAIQLTQAELKRNVLATIRDYPTVVDESEFLEHVLHPGGNVLGGIDLLARGQAATADRASTFGMCFPVR
jgi:hypothetical protein